MKNTEFDKELKSSKIRNAYLLSGNDEGFMKEYVKEIKDRIGVDESDVFGYTRLDGQKLEHDALMDALFTLPFMTEKKVIEIIRADFLNGDKSYKNSDAMIKLVTEFMEDPPENIYLIMYYVSSQTNKDTRIKSLENKVHKDRSAVILFRNINKRDVTEFIEDYFRGRGTEVTLPIKTFINDTYEGNIMQLKNELDKLLAYTEGRTITREDVSKIVTSSNTRNIFNLTDLMLEGRTREVSELYNDLIYSKVRSAEILRQVETTLKDMYNYKVKIATSKSDSEAMTKLGISPRMEWAYRIKKEQANRLTWSKLEFMFGKLLETVVRIRTTSTDDERETELLLLMITSAVKRG